MGQAGSRWLSLVLFAGLILLYYLPMAWGWHAVPFHLLDSKYTGSECARALPADLRHLPGDDATGVIMDYPNEYYAAQRARRGDPPWWNPQVGMGRPWIGNAQVHPFSPLLLPFLAWPTPWTYTLQFVMGSLVCLWGACRFLKLLGAEPLAAALGAALWTWSPFTTASVILSSVWAYWWFPWAMAGIVIALRDGRATGWALAAAAGALMILCGQPETALLLAEMAAVFAVFLVMSGGRPRLQPLRQLAELALGVALCLLLSAGQWYPILEVLSGSEWYKSTGPEHALALTHPLGDFFRPGSLVFLLPIGPASWALLLRRGSRWSAAACGAALLFCLGFSVPAIAESWPFHFLRLSGIVPPLHGAELACVPAAIMAGLGFSALLRGRAGPLPRLLTLCACGLGAALLAGGLWAAGARAPVQWLPALWLGAGTAAFCLAALVPTTRWATPLLLTAALFSATFPLAAQRFHYPYFSGCPQPNWGVFAGAQDAPQSSRVPPPRLWAQASPNTGAPYLMPNLGLLSEVCDIRSSLVLNPLGSGGFSHAWGPGGYLSHLTYGFGAATPQLLSFLGVDRALFSAPDSPTGFRPLALEDGARAFLVHRVEALNSDDACISRFRELLDQGRLSEVAVVLRPSSGETLPAWKQPAMEEKADVTWLDYSPERLALRVEAPAPGLLVITDAFSPNWEARVDGRPSPLLRADVMFRGVLLEAGAHRVELRYRTTGMALSVAVSAAAWLALLAVLAWAWWRKVGEPPSGRDPLQN